MPTLIEWVKNPDNITQGITLNSKTGCLNHTPEGLCLGGMFPCYAYKLAHGRLKERYLANDNISRAKTWVNGELNREELFRGLADPFYPRFWPERLEQIRKHKKPVGIFLDDMSDWMGDYWPKEWTEAELQVMRDCPQHRFYTLTKQPQNLPQWNFPDNCWVGGTVPNNDMWRRVIMNLGYYTKAKVKFISFEPLLERICLPPLPFTMINGTKLINWVIIGAQTRPYRPPKIEWVEEIVRAADRAGVPVFLKDNLLKGMDLPMSVKCRRLLHGAFKLRQELPDGS